ncbi:MAG: regulatory protein RecX [Bdellovibrio sp.]|nr:regulatory protein RecX [Bdellovibrio sp.]
MTEVLLFQKQLIKIGSMSLPEAKKKIMDYVANRDHSEAELRTKLQTRFEMDVTEDALHWARDQKWLAKPDALTEKVADQLHRRGKGIHSINQSLEAKGLPTTQSDFETEIAKARKLVFAKWAASDFNGLDFETAKKLQAKIMRYLGSRGFDSDVVDQILKLDLNVKGSLYDEEY